MSEEDHRKAGEQQLDEWLRGQDFYNLMQVYRMTPISPQREVVKAYDAVKDAIKQKVREIYIPESVHPDHITVYKSIGGWKAVHVVWSQQSDGLGGFWEPEQTGVGAYRTMAEAVVEGRAWAESEELEFKMPKLEA